MMFTQKLEQILPIIIFLLILSVGCSQKKTMDGIFPGDRNTNTPSSHSEVVIEFSQTNLEAQEYRELLIFADGRVSSIKLKGDNKSSEELVSSTKDVAELRELLLYLIEAHSLSTNTFNTSCKSCTVTKIEVVGNDGSRQVLVFSLDDAGSFQASLSTVIYEIDRFMRHKTSPLP